MAEGQSALRSLESGQATIGSQGLRLHLRALGRVSYWRWRAVVWLGTRTVRGRVVDPTGLPRAQVRLDIRGVEESRLVPTDAFGEFTIDEAPPTALQVRCVDDLVLAFPAPDLIPESERDTEIRLVAYDARPVRVELDGTTREDIRVWAAYDDPSCGIPRRVECRRLVPTTFVASVPPYQDLDLLAGPGGTIEQRRLGALAGEHPDTVRLRVRAKDEALATWIPVRCRSRESGQDVTPHAVLARPIDRPWELPRPVPEGRAGCLDGSRQDTIHIDGTEVAFTVTEDDDFKVCEVYDLEPGRYELYLWAFGRAPVTVIGEATAAGVYPPVEAWFDRLECRLGAEVVHAVTGVPIADATLDGVIRRGQGTFLHPLADQPDAWGAEYPIHVALRHGRVSAELPPGRYRLRAAAPGYEPAVSDVTVPGPPVRIALTTSPAPGSGRGPRRPR